MNYVLYHDKCYDGFGAAWSAWKFLGNSAVYVPVSYGKDPPPMPDAKHIFIVDFSYKRAVLEKLAETSKVTVLDHHKTAFEDLEGIPSVTSGENLTAMFDMNKSGAVIAWEFFHAADLPKLLRYIQDRDLWQWKLPESKEFAAWLGNQPKNFELWDTLEGMIESGERSPFIKGEAILKNQRATVELMAQEAYFDHIDGHKVIVCNATCLWSELGNYLDTEHPEAAFSAVWHKQKDDKVKWSFRSSKGFDVKAVAEKFGGGGHMAAAGCVVCAGELPDLNGNLKELL